MLKEKPNDILQMESLTRRLPENHSSFEQVQRDLRRRLSGVKGERAVLFPLRFIKADRDRILLHNLRIPDQNGAFEIDILLLTQQYILILEVKNWYGTIIFGENGQIIRIGDNGVEEGFANPVFQVRLQKHRLKKWLQSNGMPKMPIVYLVVISHPSTIIKSGSSRHPIPEQVIHNNELFFTIQSLDQQFTTLAMDERQLEKCGHLLKQAHTPFSTDVLTKYNIAKNSVLTGVFCPTCLRRGMIRQLQKWHCNMCYAYSKSAHLSALNDYKILIHDYISNKEARRYSIA